MTLQTSGNGTDGMRQRNLSAVLQTVAHDGPITRADLARKTGLNRSTIGALVAELSEFGFVGEAYPELTAGVGRPSAVVSVNEAISAIAVRPTSDAILVDLVGLSGTVQRHVRAAVAHVPTLADMINTSAALVDALKGDLDGGNRLLGIGVGVPGAIGQSEGSIEAIPGLGWPAAPLGRELTEVTGLPVRVHTDAHLSVIAERLYGSIQSRAEALYVIVDRFGARGGAISRGEVLSGRHGRAVDVGHLQVVANGRPCICGRRGCLDAELNVDALEAGAGPEFDRQLDLIGSALETATRILDPQVVVVDGLLATVSKATPSVLVQLGERVAPAYVATAGLPDSGVSLGSAQAVFADLLENPGVVAQRFAKPADDSQHWSRQRLNPNLFKKVGQ